ncbi:hypothetical protein [Persicitalea jodogahamensis]|uniref:Uncharacterized protein n=1 Tax=Persicitalea jodogahamensis TaxID=402147 RepID=A0A8J3D528_9BACT|nr:hypothetical protein [Persicitalea jodogahamensis]GHB76428.1 hypothetical protein GCM10007390_32950 [Persicitalea jodogahamensis]
MKKLIQPASLLLYFLSILVFFVAGLTYAGLTEAGKGQGLAGGAIVLSYGVVAALLALVIALFVACYASHAAIVKINRVFSLLAAIAILYFVYRYYNREGAVQADALLLPPTGATESVTKLTTNEAVDLAGRNDETPMGLGFFAPHFYENPVLYFYGNPNLDEPVTGHPPTDSIVFKRLTRGGFDIAYAPPWLVPDYLKLDYDMLYFRMQSVGRDFVEVTVNTRNQQIAYVRREAGKILYWPEFLLNVNSVEYLSGMDQGICVKPLVQAGKVNASYVFMRPTLIRDDWMNVHLLDEDFKKVGQGWIRWRADGRLLISYSLLS